MRLHDWHCGTVWVCLTAVAVFALIEAAASSTSSAVLSTTQNQSSVRISTSSTAPPSNAAAAFTVAISSMKFSGDMQWTYERNIEAALDAAAGAAARASSLGARMLVLPEGFFWWWMSTRQEALAHSVPFTRVVNYQPASPLPQCSHHSDGSLRAYDSGLLDNLGCIAFAHDMFIVANVASSNCSSLPPSSSSSSSSSSSQCALYNTAIVFSPNASIAATYRKTHVYGGAPPFDPPAETDVSWFEASGWKFGLLVCFDIEFLIPSQQLLQEQVHAVLVPMFWVNTPPLSWSTMYQQAWSRVFNCTVIVANTGQSAEDWGSGAYRNGHILSESFGWKEVEDMQIVTLKDPTPCQSQSRSLPAPSSSSLPLPSLSLLPPPPTFPCRLPFYGNASCALLQAPSSANSEQQSASVTVLAGNVTCSVDVDWGGDEGGDESENATVVAFDVVLQPPGVSHGLHLVACAAVVCSQQQQQQQQLQGPTECVFNNGSFLAARVSVSLALRPPLPSSATSTDTLDLSQPNFENFLYLPMAAAAGGISFPQHLLKMTGSSSVELTSDGYEEQMVQKKRGLKVRGGGEGREGGGGAGEGASSGAAVSSIVVFGIEQPQ